MPSTTQSQRRGWWCAPKLLVALIVATTLFRTCSGVTPVPVVVSTVYRSVPNVINIAVDSAGTLLLLTQDGSVYRGFPNGTTVQLVANISSGVYHFGITYDAVANVAYVTGWSTNRVYISALSTTQNVTTFAGSGVRGSADGVGTAAQLNGPCDIVHYAPTGLLYVAEYYGVNGAIRKIVAATANVTTIATVGDPCFCLCISANGTFLYVTTPSTVVVVTTTTINNVMTLAGAGSGYQDGVGAAAQFYDPRGIALNSDESALIIADRSNSRIRRLELSTNNVTTIAGSSTAGGADGPGLSATFSYPCSTRWHCNEPSMLCGSLVADSQDSTVRFVAMEGPTVTAVMTASVSTSSIGTASVTPSMESSSQSNIASPSNSYHGITSESLAATVSPTGSDVSASQSIRKTTPVTVSSTRQRSGTQRSASTSPTVYCALVPGGASGALASLHDVDVDVLPAGSNAVIIAGAEVGNDASVTSDEAVTEPVSRQTLLGGYALAANMSLTLGGTVRGVDDAADGWALVSALLDVFTTNAAFPVLSAAVGVSGVSSRVAGREQLLVCLLRPPNVTGSPRWLPSTLSFFSDVTLRLRLRLRCPTDAAVTQDVEVVVPSPGQAAVLEAEVKAAGVASQYASWVGAPAAGSAVGRLSAVRSLVQCSGDASVGGLLPLRAAVDCEDGIVASSIAANARGAVLGNLVLWAAGCALMALLTCGYAYGACVTLRTAAEALGVPSPLLPLVVATVPSTVSSTFVLLRSSCAADVAVAALGVVMCALPLGVLCGVGLAVAQRLHAQHTHVAAVPVHCMSVLANQYAPRCMSARLIWMRLLHRRLCWVTVLRASVLDVTSHGDEVRALRLERVATVVLLEYAVVWYLCVDVAVLTAAGLLGAVSTLGSPAACRRSAMAVAVLYVGQLVLCAAVRPYTTLFSHVHTLFCLALSAVSVWCQVWYLFASARDGADLDALGALLAVAAVCDIVVSAASMLKTLMDVVEALRACRRHVYVLIARVDGRSAVAEGPVLVLGAECTAPILVEEEGEVTDVVELLAEQDDTHFLRSDKAASMDGDAFVLGAAAVGAGVTTALEDMQQRHRGAAHDLLLHFRQDSVLFE